MLHHRLRPTLAATLFVVPLISAAQVGPAVCGSLQNGSNGPYDYRVVRGAKLKVVEDFHFNAKVESLVAGQSGPIGGDLDYVLRVFPNHHRALVSTARLALRSKAPTAPHMEFSAECYFERALRFRPDDHVARMLFANYLKDLKRLPEAAQQLDHVIEAARDNPFTQYNAGLIFAEMGQFDRALQQAHVAQKMGFTRPDLKQKLQAAGKWAEPADGDPTPSASSTPSSAPAAGGTASAPPQRPGS